MQDSTQREEEGIRQERRKVCPECKTAFGCFTSECWCDELPNIVPLDASRGCMCPACLEKVIDKKIELRNTKR
jgi:hypothetical protein